MKWTGNTAGGWKLDYTDELSPFDHVAKQVVEAIIADKEHKTKRALIEMGWLPPLEDSMVHSLVANGSLFCLVYLDEDGKPVVEALPRKSLMYDPGEVKGSPIE